jgi:hypothetical protein
MLYDIEQHRTLGLSYGQDLGVAGLMLLAWSCWLLGLPDEATDHVAKARELAAKLEHPFSQVFVLIHEAILAWMGADWIAVHHCANTAMKLCRRHGFPFWLTVGQILQSWSPEVENPTLAISELLRLLSDYQQRGGRIMME